MDTHNSFLVVFLDTHNSLLDLWISIIQYFWIHINSIYGYT